MIINWFISLATVTNLSILKRSQQNKKTTDPVSETDKKLQSVICMKVGIGFFII